MKMELRMPEGRDGRLWLHEPRGYVHPVHHHDELEFNLVMRGTGRYLVGERRYDLRRGSLLWLFTRQDHVLLDTSPDYAGWIMCFRPDLVKRACRDAAARVLLDPDPPGTYSRRLAEGALVELDALLRQVRSAFDDAVQFNYGAGFALKAVWRAFLQADERPHAKDVHPAVERAAWILRDRHGALDVPVLAKQAGLSADRLSRLFKRQMGLSLAQFRNRLRMQRFLELYGDGQRLGMLDAALRAGFGSYPQFHRVFKAEMGHGPRAWRRARYRYSGR
ncbi:MAG: AraC family transcriptional regulator [Planctomycetota bacterium]|nr:AraC family transcriptional regulator [Planctomycetota bacterium]